VLGPFGSSSALGAGIPTQVRPLSVVRTIEVHGLTVHGAVPSSHPVRVPTNVRSLATNPFGTGPPGGPATFASAEVEADVEADVEAGVDDAVWPAVPLSQAVVVASVSRATTAAARRNDARVADCAPR
jgi:hypothetical protein